MCVQGFLCNIWIVISSMSLSLYAGGLMGIEVYQGTRGRLEVEDELWLRGKNIKTCCQTDFWQ